MRLKCEFGEALLGIPLCFGRVLPLALIMSSSYKTWVNGMVKTLRIMAEKFFLRPSLCSQDANLGLMARQWPLSVLISVRSCPFLKSSG
jgi:hypothetical protein